MIVIAAAHTYAVVGLLLCALALSVWLSWYAGGERRRDMERVLALLALADWRELSAAQVADILSVSSARAHGALGQLERQGAVSGRWAQDALGLRRLYRITSAGDRRAAALAILQPWVKG